jgi:hypothetical protein
MDSLFFPNASGTGSGRLRLGKKTCVSLPKAYNHAAGLNKKRFGPQASALSRIGIGLTRAAKPKVSSIPSP